jgi:hypothetical protein
MVREAIRRILLVAAIGGATSGATACATAPARSRAPEVAAQAPVQENAPASSCGNCATLPVAADLAAAITLRVADLKARGGECAAYGAVLEDALTSGHIRIRPFMWRVDGNLASAQGESTGEMTVARDIDSLNVGVRRLDEVLRSAEHEAAHIAWRIPSGDPVREARVNELVDGCRLAPRD